MRRRLSLCTTALILLLAWLAATTVSPSGDHRFLLAVPADVFSVGQQFQPRLSSLASTAAVPADDVTLELRSSDGRSLAQTSATVEGMTSISTSPWSLPAPGRYQLRASGPQGLQTISLRALPAPSPNFGGVMGVTAFGLSDGVSEYLRQHGFAVTPLAPGDAGGPGIHIVVGDPRLPDSPTSDWNTRYRAFWHMVAAGASALVLQPPPPGVASYWPAIAPLASPSGVCTDDALASPFTDGLPADASIANLLRPSIVFNLQQPLLNAYHWDGRLLLKPKGQSGYPGCHALFSFRYGQGWVTVSTLPLLQHFQDVRARIVLLNMIKANARRKQRHVPPSPGLQWVTEHRLQQLAKQPPPADAAQAVFYRPPPGPVAPSPQLIPLDGSACWRAPSSAAAGATATLESPAPFTSTTLSLDFGPDPALRPSAFALLASTDGRQWTPLSSAPLDPQGRARVSLPPTSHWREIRLRIAQAPPRWSLCAMSVH